MTAPMTRSTMAQGRPIFRYRAAYLGYILLYPVPWFIHRTPDLAQLAYSAAALVVFLLLYFAPYRPERRYGISEIILTALIGFSAVWTHGDWMVFNIYASGMTAAIASRKRAITVVVLLQVALVIFCMLKQRPMIEAAIGVLLSVITYIGTWMQWELGRRNIQLQEAQHEIHRLAATAERERIARDMHDLLGHSLTVISVKAELAERLIHANSDRAQREIADIARIARTSLADVRQAVSGMNGSSLQHTLPPTRDALSAAGIALTLEGAEALSDHPQSSVLAMALREAVTNIIRHSNARTCHISFACDRNGHAHALTVTDDGQTETPSLVEGNGLNGMRARLRAAGGSLTLSHTSSGLTLTASLNP